MVHLIRDQTPFNLQFGRSVVPWVAFHAFADISRSGIRQVLVSLLNVPERMNWKACMLTEEEDRTDAQAFKTAFAPFDPSL